MLPLQLLRRARTTKPFLCHAPHNRCSISSAAQSYLAGWVGLSHPSSNSVAPKSNENPVAQARATMVQGPLLLSGSSYLLPTLRLEQRETPESLKIRLEQASGPKGVDGHLCCPIVLDASALAPDGSPHYQPPEPGSLVQMFSILNDFGMKVMGITAANRELSAALTEEASQAGIPLVWSPRKAGSDPKFDVAQVIQYMQRRQEEEDQNSTSSIANGEQADTSSVRNDERTNEIRSETISERAIDENIPQSTSNSEDMPKYGEAEAIPSESLPTPMEFSSTSSSTVYHGSVRSGQQVMSKKGQSLVILGSVNSGGEVLSDGDIFIYGKLRGRAMAGLGADPNSEEENESASARIVATSFDAELVAIGDVFTTIDKVEDLNSKFPLKPGAPVMVTVEVDPVDESVRSLKFIPLVL